MVAKRYLPEEERKVTSPRYIFFGKAGWSSVSPVKHEFSSCAVLICDGAKELGLTYLEEPEDK